MNTAKLNKREIRKKQNDEEKKRTEFISILLELAKLSPTKTTNPQISDMIIRLESFYHIEGSDKNFRHFYSDVFIVIAQIKSGEKKGDLDALGLNIKNLRRKYTPQNKDSKGLLIDISDSLRKLDDHVSLDCARIAFEEGQNRSLSGEDALKDVNARITETRTELNSNYEKAKENLESLKKDYDESKKTLHDTEESVMKAEENITDIRDEVKDIQKKYITVLGIFSSIVLAFTSGIAFSTSVFQNMHLSSPYRVVVVCLLIAFALINPFFILVFYLRDVWGKSAKKETEIKFVVAFNVIIMVLIALTTIFWGFGLVEKRNAAVEKDLESTTSAVTEAKTENTTQTLETLIETTGVTVASN